MKILFYSTNSNHYESGRMEFKMIPSCREQWNSLKKKYPECDFVIVMQKPGMFLYDESGVMSDRVKYIFIDEQNSDAEKIAQVIISEKPDTAIAVSYWKEPFDWMSIKDAVIAEKLRDAGIKTVCHDADTCRICFDKNETRQFLINNNFNVAKGVYVHHELFYAERGRNCINENVYREYIFSEIKKLKFPVVIKETSGLSSYGMDVVTTFNQARHVLLSKKNNGDRVVEEFLDGISFGIEVYGTDGKYLVSPPLVNSVNQFGLTSPKQNVKLGPVENEKFGVSELRKEVARLAGLLKFSGIAQIDLVYSDGAWWFIEINSRISGMTQTMAFSMGLSLYELILFSAGIIGWNGVDDTGGSCNGRRAGHKGFKNVMNLKFPLLDEKALKRLSGEDFVGYVNQIENLTAKQLREKGYSEVIFGGNETLFETMKQLDILNEAYADKMEKVFYENAYRLSQII
ncbi:MAG: ATP-grasp domain-containing protein [Treponema sp.]|nr:ATP-grasp domain-containing protein [Treponema sp.]